MYDRDVCEFIIVPPYARRAEIMRAQERFRHFLSSRFPGYTFAIPGFTPVDDNDDFGVVPMMNFVGDDGKTYTCLPVKRWLLSDIARACGEFDMGGRQSCAA